MIRQANIVWIGLLLALVAGCGGPAAQPAIFLGHVATLSGADGRAGKSAEQGIALALKELGPAASADFAGRPLVVRHVDAGGDLDNLESEAARLVSVNKALGLLGGGSREEALRLERCRAPALVSLGFRAPALSELCFTTGLAPAAQAQALAQYLVENHPAAGTLIVDPRREEATAFGDEFGRAWRDALEKKSPGASARWGQVTLPKDAKLDEWASLIVKSQPKAVVFAGAAADFDGLRRALGAATPLLIFAGTDGSWTPTTPLIVGQTILVATAFAVGAEAPVAAQEFAKNYRAAYREDPDVHAAQAYDNVRLFGEAIKKCWPDKTDKLREELLKIKDFPGLTGPISFTAEQHLQRTTFVARVETGGMPIALKSYRP